MCVVELAGVARQAQCYVVGVLDVNLSSESTLCQGGTRQYLTSPTPAAHKLGLVKRHLARQVEHRIEPLPSRPLGRRLKQRRIPLGICQVGLPVLNPGIAQEDLEDGIDVASVSQVGQPNKSFLG